MWQRYQTASAAVSICPSTVATAGAHHPPTEDKDENGVEDDIDQRPRQGRGHRKPGASVRADDGVQRLSEHVKGHAQGDPEEVLFGMAKGLIIDPSAEHRQDALLKHKINCRQDQADGNTQQHGAADALVGVLPVPRPQADADKSAAAIADHYGQRQGHHRQRENHRIGRVAIGAQIVRVGDKQLIHDVVKGRHSREITQGTAYLPISLPMGSFSKKAFDF